jgi:hypothetical protein
MTGRKWSASKAVNKAESCLKHKKIVNTVASGRKGLAPTTLERNRMIQREIKAKEEEIRQTEAVELG